ncbi:MAG TPA: histidinol-phosphate transaminase [Rhodanobacteraceae bacterium]
MSVLTRVRPDLADFRAYASARSHGLDARVLLNANEAPYDAARASRGCNRYPEPQPAALRAGLASLYGVAPERLWIGRGSDEAIDLLLRAFCRAGRDNIVTPAPTFGMYRVGAKLQGAACREVALDAEAGFALDPERLLARVDADTKLVIVCSPNNPTGTSWHATLDYLAERLENRALLVVDEAYVEFADAPSVVALLDRHENIAVLRTLSKAHALAGARVGALIAHPALAALVARIAAPYPLPSPSIALALAALEPTALAATRARIAAIRAERERVRWSLAALANVCDVWPSAANFVLARFDDARAAFERALEAGVLLRDVSDQQGLAGCLRITIGSTVENDALLGALDGARAPAATAGVFA